jgi:hypothetical protein
VPLADVPSKHALTVVIGRGLGELARAGDVAPADIEPITHHMPLRDVACSAGVHGRFSFLRLQLKRVIPFHREPC